MSFKWLKLRRTPWVYGFCYKLWTTPQPALWSWCYRQKQHIRTGGVRQFMAQRECKREPSEHQASLSWTRRTSHNHLPKNGHLHGELFVNLLLEKALACLVSVLNLYNRRISAYLLKSSKYTFKYNVKPLESLHKKSLATLHYRQTWLFHTHKQIKNLYQSFT